MSTRCCWIAAALLSTPAAAQPGRPVVALGAGVHYPTGSFASMTRGTTGDGIAAAMDVTVPGFGRIPGLDWVTTAGAGLNAARVRTGTEGAPARRGDFRNLHAMTGLRQRTRVGSNSAVYLGAQTGIGVLWLPDLIVTNDVGGTSRLAFGAERTHVLAGSFGVMTGAMDVSARYMRFGRVAASATNPSSGSEVSQRVQAAGWQLLLMYRL